MNWLAVLAITTFLVIGGCSSPDKPLSAYLERRDLQIASATVELDAAIAQTNLILAAGQSELRLEAAIEQRPERLRDHSVVPVAWVTAPASAHLPMAHVPDGVRGIVLNSRSIGGFLYRYASDRKPLYFGDRPLKVGEPAQLLALILLHETGHVALDHAGSFDAHHLDSSTQHNPLKEMELAADEFAADRICAALGSPDAIANHAANELRLLTRRFLAQQVSERFARYPPTHAVSPFTRAANPNATPAGDRRVVYADPAPTHPNLELRMMVIGYRIDPTPDSARSLRSYLDARGDSVLPRLLRLPEPDSTEEDTP